MFQLTKDEKERLVANCDHLKVLNEKIQAIFSAIKQLLEPPKEERKIIGFQRK